MTRYATRPAVIPDARIVRRLEATLPPQPLKLEAICNLLADDRNTKPHKADVLRALQDLQERGLATRVRGKGWRLDSSLHL